MSVSLKEQRSSQPRTCNMKNIFVGLLMVMVISVIILSQILYHKERRPGKDSVRSFIRKSTTLLSSGDANKSVGPLNRKSVGVLNRKPAAPLNRKQNNQKCPDVLRLMADGKWIPRKTSKREIDDVEKFLEFARGTSIVRQDGRCGNIGLPGRKTMRALCDPKGDKPCCHEHTCKSLPVEQCRCKDCYDVRQRIHAEYATWKPNDIRCKMRNFTAMEACKLLSGSKLVLIGDSLIRQLYQAFQMVVKNDGRFGALHPKVTEKDRLMCEGMYSFSTGMCRPMWHARPGLLCNGTFGLRFVSHSRSTYGPELLQMVKGELKKEKVILMPGLGLHENCNDTKIKRYLNESIALLKSKKARWPKLVWATVHAPGLLKAPMFARQEFHVVAEFNRKMRNYLQALGIPVFDTFNLTKDTVLIDGTHVGFGVNIAKVQLFLNYLQELRDKQQW